MNAVLLAALFIVLSIFSGMLFVARQDIHEGCRNAFRLDGSFSRKRAFCESRSIAGLVTGILCCASIIVAPLLAIVIVVDAYAVPVEIAIEALEQFSLRDWEGAIENPVDLGRKHEREMGARGYSKVTIERLQVVFWNAKFVIAVMAAVLTWFAMRLAARLYRVGIEKYRKETLKRYECYLSRDLRGR